MKQHLQHGNFVMANSKTTCCRALYMEKGQQEGEGELESQSGEYTWPHVKLVNGFIYVSSLAKPKSGQQSVAFKCQWVQVAVVVAVVAVARGLWDVVSGKRKSRGVGHQSNQQMAN